MTQSQQADTFTTATTVTGVSYAQHPIEQYSGCSEHTMPRASKKENTKLSFITSVVCSGPPFSPHGTKLGCDRHRMVGLQRR